MYHSQSAPGLGKGDNPLHEYRSDSKSLLSLCAEEQEAERLYYAAISSSLPKKRSWSWRRICADGQPTPEHT